jgi:antitoxin component YwqK of YwqJK toxin-antitoxin module
MMRRTLLVLLLVLPACGPTRKDPATGKNAADEGADAITYDRNRCAAKDHRVVRLTTREDGKPDIWKFYTKVVEAGTTLDVLVCKQVDINHDGKVDVVTYYDKEGRVAKEEIDLDFDGKFDETVYYEVGKVVRKEYDRNGDGKIDTWAYFENEKLVRIERDSKFRGKIDTWEYYEAGRLERVGYDTTGSGRVDRWERAPEVPDDDDGPAPAPRPQPAAVAPAVKK